MVEVLQHMTAYSVLDHARSELPPLLLGRRVSAALAECFEVVAAGFTGVLPMDDHVSRPAMETQTSPPVPEDTSPSRLAPLLVIAEMASFQCGSGIAKKVFHEASPLLMAAMRIGFAAIVITVLVRPSIKGLTRIQWLSVGGLGITTSTMNITYFYTISLIPLGIATGLELVGPLVVSALWARGWRQWLAVTLAVIGTVWLAGPSGSLSSLGVLLGLIASALRGAYVVLNRRVGSAVAGWSGLSLALSVGALLVIPLTVLIEGSQLRSTPALVGDGFLVAVFSSLIPYSLDFIALRRISMHAFSILLALSPVIGALTGLIMLGEHQTLTQWTAMLIVVAAALLATINASPPNNISASKKGVDRAVRFSCSANEDRDHLEDRSLQ
jgi:inner membrane transporter RhtA